ncbi:hypothetical protein LAZ67_3000804 [Cordylochernes scorpioides]|uniref:Transposase n=1 Tax=Cordylochernes scorpioides TaxID=51811 RepID=A0ABY6K6G7_9ARAC|nr:hypothetical protein LAZ67_3000804 [Cordylochernes scorpioides]
MAHIHEDSWWSLNVSAPKSGRPPTAVTQEKIELVRFLLIENLIITYQRLEKCVDIGSAAITNIINDHLKYRNIVSKWVPHSLTEPKTWSR